MKACSLLSFWDGCLCFDCIISIKHTCIKMFFKKFSLHFTAFLLLAETEYLKKWWKIYNSAPCGHTLLFSFLKVSLGIASLRKNTLLHAVAAGTLTRAHSCWSALFSEMYSGKSTHLRLLRCSLRPCLPPSLRSLFPSPSLFPPFFSSPLLLSAAEALLSSPLLHLLVSIILCV